MLEKSEVVKRIMQDAKMMGKTTAVVCSSGISCTVYGKGIGLTVHSWYGLQTAELPWKQLITHAMQDHNTCKRLRDVNLIIWDEASMSSQRMLEIVNNLHHQVSDRDENRQKLFTGKQLILVGEFLQLKPIPSVFDNGNFFEPLNYLKSCDKQTKTFYVLLRS